MTPKKDHLRKTALSVADISKCWNDLGKREGMAATAIHFLILTAARSQEVRGMIWDEVELQSPQGAIWTVPADRMKNARPHRVPLPQAAVKVLKRLPRMEGSPYVFFAPTGGMLSDMALSSVMLRMHKAEVKAGREGYLEPNSNRYAILHGLRSTFRQWAVEQEYPRYVSELALGHWIGSGAERVYQRADMLDKRRSMMEDWASYLVCDAEN